MPRYTAVAPTFTPLDYKTRIAPLEQYKEEYDKRMDALDEQGVLADAIGGLIDENQDPELARTYKDYNDKMVSTAQDLLRTGDLGSSRRALGELRKDYANKLIPIQQAYNLRAEDAKADREMHRKDPSYRSNNPLNNPLSAYMNGNMPDQFGVSGDKLYAEGLADAKAQSERVHRILQDWKVDPKLGNEWYTKRIASGYNADETAAMLAEMAGVDLDNAKTQEEIKQLSQAGQYVYNAMNRIYSANGVDNLTSDADRAHMQGRILDGIVAGLTYKESDEEKQHDPLLGLKAAKLRAELNPTRTDPRNTSTKEYLGKYGKEGRIIAEKTKELSKPITDPKTGRIVRNGLEAYFEVKKAEDRASLVFESTTIRDLQKQADKLRAEMNKTDGWNFVHTGEERRNIQRQLRGVEKQIDSERRKQTEYREEYHRVKNLYKDIALTNKEYNDIKKAIGFSEDRDMTIEDINDAIQNNIDFSSAQAYNVHNIAHKGYMDNLKENIASTIRTNASNRSKEIYRTNDGVHPDGKAISYKSGMFDDKNIESIDMSAFNVANGQVLITCADKSKYLVPIEYLGNEAGLSVYANLRDGFSGMLSGTHSNSIDEILTYLDDILHDAVVTTQQNNGHNFYQSQSSTSKSRPAIEE